ncbi:MAG: hypothetical protein ACRCX2_12245 [Paraclostridium sp.]
MLYLIAPDNSVVTVINKDIMKKVILTHQMNPDLVLDAEADEKGMYPTFRTVVVGVCDEIGFESLISKSNVRREDLKIIPYTQSLLGQLVTDYYDLLVQEHGLDTMNQALADAVKEYKVEDMSIDLDMICDIFNIDINTPTSLHASDVPEDQTSLNLTQEEMDKIAKENGVFPTSETKYADVGKMYDTPSNGVSLGEASENLIGIVPKTGILGEPAGGLKNITLGEVPGAPLGSVCVTSKDYTNPLSTKNEVYILDDVVWEIAKSMAPQGVNPEKYADEFVNKCIELSKVDNKVTSTDDLYAAMGLLD